MSVTRVLGLLVVLGLLGLAVIQVRNDGISPSGSGQVGGQSSSRQGAQQSEGLSGSGGGQPAVFEEDSSDISAESNLPLSAVEPEAQGCRRIP